MGSLPPAFSTSVPPAWAGLPGYFFSWSALAQINPYLEQTNIYKNMDLTQPIYVPPTLHISPANQFAVQQVVKLFLCPSDQMQPVATGMRRLRRSHPRPHQLRRLRRQRHHQWRAALRQSRGKRRHVLRPARAIASPAFSTAPATPP